MPRGGQNRKSGKLHMLEDTYRPDRHGGKNQPKPRPTAPTCPSWLNKEAKAEWKRLAPELERLGLLTHLDRAGFAVYCQSWASWRACEEVICREGAVIEGHRGVMRKHPLLSAARGYMDAVRAWCQEFGLTPSSRGRMSVGVEEPQEEPSWLD